MLISIKKLVALCLVHVHVCDYIFQYTGSGSSSVGSSGRKLCAQPTDGATGTSTPVTVVSIHI